MEPLTPATEGASRTAAASANQARDANRRLFWACLAEGGLVGLAWLLAWLFEVPLLSLINPPGRQTQAFLIGLAATAPMVVFLLWMNRTRWAPVVDLRVQAERLVGRLTSGASPASVLTIALLAGIGEELLFRGTLQPALGARLTPWGGVAAASLLFGLAHPLSRAYVVVAGIGGLYLGTLAQLTGEVLSATVAHAAYDIVALAWLGRRGEVRQGP